MRKNGAATAGQLSAILCVAERFLDKALLERVGGRAVEISSLSTFILWLLHLIRGGEAPGQDTVKAS